MDEKRKTDREPVTLFVEYEGADDLVGDYTENLSSGGTFVATNRVLPIGTAVQLVLGFPGLLEPIAIEGIVRWTRGEAEGAGAGIQFSPGPARDELASVIARIRERDPQMVSRIFRVLVVEDNRHVANLIHDGLRGSARREFGGGVQFAVRSAEDGRQAIEILRREKFDALIVDIYLPVLDGARVIQAARTELGLGNLAIIAVSAGGESARKSALEAGANIFLDKPMRLRQVIDTIHKLLG
ncbi:MAG TPA: response regulator [Kofleriaceae bacterium]|nr:response regulator [Kofleriaceae bacterium]